MGKKNKGKGGKVEQFNFESKGKNMEPTDCNKFMSIDNSGERTMTPADNYFHTDRQPNNSISGAPSAADIMPNTHPRPNNNIYGATPVNYNINPRADPQASNSGVAAPVAPSSNNMRPELMMQMMLQQMSSTFNEMKEELKQTREESKGQIRQIQEESQKELEKLRQELQYKEEKKNPEMTENGQELTLQSSTASSLSNLEIKGTDAELTDDENKSANGDSAFHSKQISNLNSAGEKKTPVNTNPNVGPQPGTNVQVASSSDNMTPELMMQMMFLQMNNNFNDMKGELQRAREESRGEIRQIKEESDKKLEKLHEELRFTEKKKNSRTNADNESAMEVDQPLQGNQGKSQNLAPVAESGGIARRGAHPRNPQVQEMFQNVTEMMNEIGRGIGNLPLPMFGNDAINYYFNIEDHVRDVTTGPVEQFEGEILNYFPKYYDFLQGFLKRVEERKFLGKFLEQGVEYLNPDCNIPHFSRKMHDRKLYVLYFLWSEVESSQQIWELFQSLIDYQSSNEMTSHVALYDLENQERTEIMTNVIKIYHNGDLVCDDMLQEMSQFENICTTFSGKYESRPTPEKKVNFEAPCPLAKDKTCPASDAMWICINCAQVLDYGFDFYLYCHCGAARVENVRFKCNAKSHGIKHVFHEKEDIKPLLDNMKSFNGLTILILGETGVGKSTFINGFANYMQYPTLQRAKESGDLISPVKSTFIMTDDNFKLVTISTGDEENECNKVGQSATQATKAHVFNYKGSVDVRLIDTPGIGDTRGIEQDKENFKNILAYISYYEEIHGICILLKPNNSRLTTMFEFCIKELLIHLHKDVAKNIVFCFTNARNTNYRPGDTFPALKELLEQSGHNTDLKLSNQNVFCMDNESFRYLAACKKGIAFTEEDDKIYSASWERAANETNRMMKYIRDLKSHKVKDTLSVNDVRRKILDMTKPLAEIAKTIDNTVMNLEDQKKEIANSQSEAEELFKKINIQVPSLERKTLSHPRTVCTALECHEVHKMDGKDIMKFTKHCHEQCYLRGVQTDITNNPELKSCAAMETKDDTTSCRKCGCVWNTHMHVTYEMVSVKRGGEDKSAKKTYEDVTDRIKLKEAAVADYQRVINELKSEKEEILRATASFGFFIKENSVIPYNDAMVSYLNLLIKVEREKADQSQDYTKVERMMELKGHYEQEVQVIKDAVHKGVADDNKLAEIQNQDQIMKRLLSLKHYGENMKTTLAQMEEDRTRRVNNFEENRYVTKSNPFKQAFQAVPSGVSSFYKFIADGTKTAPRYHQPAISSSHSKNQLKYGRQKKNKDKNFTSSTNMNRGLSPTFTGIQRPGHGRRNQDKGPVGMGLQYPGTMARQGGYHQNNYNRFQ